MNWKIRTIALLFFAIGIFVAYRCGLNDGRNEAHGIAITMKAAGSRNAISYTSSIVSNPSIWEGITRKSYSELMANYEASSSIDLQRAFNALSDSQKNLVIYHIIGDITAEEMIALKNGIPIPIKTNVQQAASSNR